MDFDKLAMDGWVYIPSFVPKDKVLKIENKIKNIFGVGGFDELSKKIIELDKCDQSLLYQYNLSINRITEILSLAEKIDELLTLRHPKSSGVVLDHYVLLGLPADQRLAYSWHQESSYIPTVPTVYTMWTPLFTPSTRENGTMSVLSGTHKLGNIGYSRLEKPHGYCDLVVDTKELIPKHPEYFCCNAIGDCILFEKDLVHRSNFNITDKVRISLLLRIGHIDTVTQLSGWKDGY
jgi:ectoine hydroxylase-related dioxygenase (phytanoyl-CoA dioxygenase family)